MKRGFSTLEMLIAMAILISAFTVVILLSSAQSLSVDSRTSGEALSLARKSLETEQSLARKDFKLVVATTSNETIGGIVYTKKIDITQTGLFTKKVTAMVTWPGTYGRAPSTVLTSLVTNFQNAVGGDTCSTVLTDSAGVHGNWKNPVITNTTFATAVGDANANGMYPMTDIDAHQKRLYVTVATSSSAVGANNPGTGVDSNVAGSITWSSPSRITLKDSSSASLTLSGTTVSHYLKATNFGFAVPPGSTVLGIRVDIFRSASGQSGSNAVVDSQVKIIRADGTLGSSNKASATSWVTGQIDAPYGSATDLWSETNWTPAAINNANFGVVLAVTGTGSAANRTASVDSIQVTVYYTKQFYIFDITNPASPVLLGGLATSTLSGSLNAVAVATSSSAGNFAYVATNATTGTNQLQIIDVTTPQAPFIKATYPSIAPACVSGLCMGVGVGNTVSYKDGYAYLGLTHIVGEPAADTEFNIIDVSSPTAPQWKGGYGVGSTVSAIVVKDGYAYLSTNDTTKELIVLNITNPASPSLVGTYNATPDTTNFGYGRALSLVGDTTYLGRSWIANAAEFLKLDVSAATPVFATSTDIGPNSSNPFSVNGITIRDSLVFILLGSQTNGGSLKITDLATGNIWTATIPNGTAGVGGVALDCEGNYLYAASVDSGNRGYLTSVTGQ